MGQGVPPGNKIPVSAKECKPRKKAKGSWAPWWLKNGVSVGAGPVRAAHRDPEPGVVPCLTWLSPEASTSHLGAFLYHCDNSWTNHHH